ncbi:MAG: hypothetical protein M3306_14990 [Actinomycetota bacterium]|nr:hypothetical protein [Actinomycetota bacterium]
MNRVHQALKGTEISRLPLARLDHGANHHRCSGDVNACTRGQELVPRAERNHPAQRSNLGDQIIETAHDVEATESVDVEHADGP